MSGHHFYWGNGRDDIFQKSARIAKVNPKVNALGESGFADGSGTYELIMADEGVKETSKVEFNFRYMTEPHCTITKIKLSNVM